MRLWRVWVVLGLWAGVGAACVTGQSAGCPSSSEDRVVHVGVLARGLDGEPLRGLSSEDFELDGPAGRIPVVAAQTGTGGVRRAAGLPTHVLLLIPPMSAYGAEQAVAFLLNQQLPQRFGDAVVSLYGRDGEATGYVGDRATLVAAVRGFAHRHVPVGQALRELGSMPGRRVVLYLADDGAPVPTPFRRAAAQVAAEVYQVGGDRAANYVGGGEQTFVPPSFSAGMVGFGSVDQGGIGVTAPPVTYGEVWTKSVRDVVVERSLRDAFRKVAKDGLGFYDLAAQMPGDSPEIELKLHVRHNYQMTAQVYGEGCLPVLRLPAKQRE